MTQKLKLLENGAIVYIKHDTRIALEVENEVYDYNRAYKLSKLLLFHLPEAPSQKTLGLWIDMKNFHKDVASHLNITC